MKKREAGARKQAASNHHPTHEHIAVRAYEIYMLRGAAHGRDLDDWLQAERELAAKSNNASARRHALAI